ncbi:MAG: 30S ribosomal protein S6 [Chloroflexi bacterium]|nr:MAG: 30S ribosomal protein S6 [Chloroflexota bacterium]TMF16834.1 MAG: 30S ribosomal protein S6 [Chloroflexota bacterium]
MRDYELMYIVRPELDEEALRTAAKSVRGLIETQGGEVVKTTLWGKRRLAYEVKRLRDGYYVLVVLRLDGGKVAPVERALRIHDTVFRHLLVLHQGPMPEPDGEIEEAQLQVEGAGAGVPEAEVAEAVTVDAASVQTEEDVPDEELEEAPSASDDEGDK